MQSISNNSGGRANFPKLSKKKLKRLKKMKTMKMKKMKIKMTI